MDLKDEDDSTLAKLHSAHTDLKTFLEECKRFESNFRKTENKFKSMEETLNMAAQRTAPLQTLSISTKALDARINRAISPALALLDNFRLYESVQRRLLEIASNLISEEKASKKRLKELIKYLDCVDKLHEAIDSISQESEPAILKLQEVVEYLSRTKATDRYRTERLTETLVTLKALHEAEMDSMRFDGMFDEALLNLQDELEGLLRNLRHRKIGEDDDDEGEGDRAANGTALGSDLEIDVLRRIAETLASNDCLDICIDIFVKVRYRRAAKALMKLSPDYLKTYAPEEINGMEWAGLETAISLWIQHFELAVRTVFVSEKRLCGLILGNVVSGLIWPECFIKISDKIMAVFFRFGEGVARSSKEPQKLFKLLDMFDSLEKLRPEFSEIFSGESGADIRTRFRELEKLLVHASTRVFWGFGLQIEGSQHGLPPPRDGSVPKLVRYAVNYLKNLAADPYGESMGRVLRTEHMWKSGIVREPEGDRELLRDAVANVVEAIQRNVESKKSRYKDRVLAHIFSMNTYWYIYMRTRNTELEELLGDAYMKKRYRNVAEESAYVYQKHAWGTLVKLLEKDATMRANDKDEDELVGLVRSKLEAFTLGFDEMCHKHKSVYSIVSDADLREQMKNATARLVVPAYREFCDAYAPFFVDGSYQSPESVEGLLGKIFEGGDDGGVDAYYGGGSILSE